MDPPLEVLASTQQPVRRRLGPDPVHGLAEAIGIGVGVPAMGRRTRPLEELDQQPGAGVRRGRHPLLVEAVEVAEQVLPRLALAHHRHAGSGFVALTRQERQVVAEQVEGDALHRPRRALGGPLPVGGVEAAQEVEKHAALGRVPVDEIERACRSHRARR